MENKTYFLWIFGTRDENTDSFSTWDFKFIINFIDRVALHVDVHVAGQHIYWCDYDPTGMKLGNNNGIRRIRVDGSGYEEVVVDGIGMKSGEGIKGIAVDWIAGTPMITA